MMLHRSPDEPNVEIEAKGAALPYRRTEVHPKLAEGNEIADASVGATILVRLVIIVAGVAGQSAS